MSSTYKNKTITLPETKYTLKKIVGQGGNGEVWLASSAGSDSEYAVKIFTPKERNSKKIERFIREVEFGKNSNHPNIIKIIDWAEIEGVFYCIMPFYKANLLQVMHSKISEEKAFSYIRQLCQAIQYAHGKEVIHRDIKPENILIDEADNLVLADFGIAHFIDSSLTDKNDLLANRNYASPEQKIKSNALHITKAADIYSLGAIINELFTGSNPSGSEFIKISYVNPTLYKIDDLVYRSMKQAPEERPIIDEILLKLKLIEGEIKDTLESIEEWLYYDTPSEISEDKLSRIIKRASKDILLAKALFETKSLENIYYFNSSYHRDIHYSMSSELKALYFQKEVYRICMSKFNYESVNYKSDKLLFPLDLRKNEDKLLYDRLRQIVSNYIVDRAYIDFTGKIFKLFVSCFDYHCKEILRDVESVEQHLNTFNNLPIIYIIQYLLEHDITVQQYEELKIEEHIDINWEETLYETDHDEKLHSDIKDYKAEEILSKVCERWDALYSKQDTDYYSLIFKSRKAYEDFKEYSLELAKPHYIFEGDVLEVLRIKREYDGVIELNLLSFFEIKNTLAKIIGLREI